MTRAQITRRALHVPSMLGYHRARVVSMRKEASHDHLAPDAANPVVAQVLEQCLAMDQRERNREELSFLHTGQALGCDPMHKRRVLILPTVVDTRILENAGCQAFLVRLTGQHGIADAPLR